ncbi:hypothetical protein Bca52824_023663 [Brassica carinata]|uniref:C2 domain-containing protein n=1 Tax=Brassica carinata TaxID=52824 RepID=A0A8X7VIW5_BRACI|nr:hypothetical protein Bca52824_023663 [Brassica carinata]
MDKKDNSWKRVRHSRRKEAKLIAATINVHRFPTYKRLVGGGMVEFIGLLKVTVKRGTNLAIRDMMSRDAYVVLNLGKHVSVSLFVNCNLNSVWNQELMCMFVTAMQVYDYDTLYPGKCFKKKEDDDTFSADGIMGEAQLDIQPLITSAMAFGDPEMFGDMQIGKWLKSHDNPLIDDSIINIADGKVKQAVQIKLQNGEWRIIAGNGMAAT